MADRNSKDEFERELTNADPVTGAPGAHPVGVGAGAAAGGAAGAAVGGAVAGPIGAMVGAAVGVVAGGLGGKAAAEVVNPTLEEDYWRDAWERTPYARRDLGYDAYRAAYRYGWEARAMHRDRTWPEVEPELRRGWDEYRGTQTHLPWDDAVLAARDAWDRLSHPPAEGGPRQDRDETTTFAPETRKHAPK